jgi:uncharacterized protein (UPF0332 family)
MTPDQALLLQKARGRIELAQQLASQTPVPQTAIDTIAYHAYYAMLHIAAAFLQGEGIIRNSHSGIQAAFGEHFAKTQRLAPEFHRYLIVARGMRESADYRPRPTVTMSGVQEQLAHALEFLELARKELGEIPDPP